ncbi:type II secretion system protein N [Agaribacter marinus]|uniref:Type II secretion system protein N n=1 Tax=Agaribacter marinus TaxID=1431249 RepID=A0AA37T0F6_9ALTE|nr:type II secretion system protein N [Agaribacter marinus]GLR71445.1 hypothetical protein GCM10007852_23530 [Agaribacter marinus]
MRVWQWILFCVLIYVLGLVIYAPASLLTNAIQKNSQNKVLFSTPNGTFFSGGADQVIVNGININNVKWELSPLKLLLLSANVDITGGNLRDMAQTYVAGDITINLLDTNDLNIQNLQTYIPVKTLLAQVQLPVFITAEGRVRANIQHLDASPNCIELTGTGSWQNAAISSNGKVTNLGSFDANLSCVENAYVITMNNKNILNLDASLSLTTTGSYKVSGKFKPDDSLPSEIKQAANFFGQPDQQGFYQINF